jgi:hypothetical protein
MDHRKGIIVAVIELLNRLYEHFLPFPTNRESQISSWLVESWIEKAFGV